MAELYAVNVKNNSGGDIFIEDLGITIPDGTTLAMDEQYDYHEIFGSHDLRGFVATGTLVINNDIGDLSVANGLSWIKPLNEYDAKGNFYTKTELQTSGSALVNWGNITNAPAIGSVAWKEPVEYVVLNTTATSGAAVDGDIIVSGSNYLQYDGAAWNSIGTVLANDRVIDLSATGDAIVAYDGAAWNIVEAPTESDAVMVSDDGDGGQAQYIYDGTQWIKIGDVDWGQNQTLDDAYDTGGPGAGRVVTVDTGAVKLDATSSTYSPLELTQQSALPTSGLAAGQVAVKDGILCVYDGSRSKWLSVQRQYLVFGKKGITSNQYLAFAGGNVFSNNSGYRIPRNATIVAISGQLDASGTVSFRVRSNDSASNIATLALSAVTGAQDIAVNVNMAQGDFMQMYSDNATSVSDPMVIVEIAYRP